MSKAMVNTTRVGINNVFEDDVYIGEDVEIGDNNVFKRGTVIERKVRIGKNNLFSNYVVVGSQGEMGLKGDIIPEDGLVEIGDNNKVREFVVISFPTKTNLTKIGNDNYLMARSHVPHDCILGNKIVMAPNSVLGGGTHIQDNVFVGLNAAVHHGKKLGEGSMIAMQAAVNKSVPPYITVGGVPARIRKLNRLGAERKGFSKEILDEVENNLEDILNLKYTNTANLIISKIHDFIKQNDCLNF